MTAEVGIRYNGLKKYMLSGAAYIQRPELVIEKTVEVCRVTTVNDTVVLYILVAHFCTVLCS